MKKGQLAAVLMFLLAAVFMFWLGVKQGNWSDFVVGVILLFLTVLTFILFRKERECSVQDPASYAETVMVDRHEPTILDMSCIRRVRK